MADKRDVRSLWTSRRLLAAFSAAQHNRLCIPSDAASNVQFTRKLHWIRMERWHLRRFPSISVATLYCPVFTRTQPWFNYCITSTSSRWRTRMQADALHAIIQTAKLARETWLGGDWGEKRMMMVVGEGLKMPRVVSLSQQNNPILILPSKMR